MGSRLVFPTPLRIPTVAISISGLPRENPQKVCRVHTTRKVVTTGKRLLRSDFTPQKPRETIENDAE